MNLLSDKGGASIAFQLVLERSPLGLFSKVDPPCRLHHLLGVMARTVNCLDPAYKNTAQRNIHRKTQHVEDWLVALRDRPDEDVINPRVRVQYSEIVLTRKGDEIITQYTSQTQDWPVTSTEWLDEDATNPCIEVQYFEKIVT